MRRGEIRWCTYDAPDKRRPAMVLSRDEAVAGLHEVLVVPITRTVRGKPFEVQLGAEDGMPYVCAMNFDHFGVANKGRVGTLISVLRHERWPDVERALLFACGFSSGKH